MRLYILGRNLQYSQPSRHFFTPQGHGRDAVLPDRCERLREKSCYLYDCNWRCWKKMSLCEIVSLVLFWLHVLLLILSLLLLLMLMFYYCYYDYNDNNDSTNIGVDNDMIKYASSFIYFFFLSFVLFYFLLILSFSYPPTTSPPSSSSFCLSIFGFPCSWDRMNSWYIFFFLLLLRLRHRLLFLLLLYSIS